jgi:hypothetical protein
LVGIYQRDTEGIGRGEEPAATGGALICDWRPFHRYCQVEKVLIIPKGAVIDEYVCERVASEA